jgi:hypothetical protein
VASAGCVIVVATFEAPAVVAGPAIVRQPAEIERKLDASASLPIRSRLHASPPHACDAVDDI